MPFDPTAAAQVCEACGREYPYAGGPDAICPACPGGGPDGDSHLAVSEAEQAAWAAAQAGEPGPHDESSEAGASADPELSDDPAELAEQVQALVPAAEAISEHLDNLEARTDAVAAAVDAPDEEPSA